MAYDDFVKLFARYKGFEGREEALVESNDRHLRYALSNRERGRNHVERFKKVIELKLSDVRLLDVGCAYGGMTIEFARAGAEATGVELVPSYVDLARENAIGEADVDFFIADVTMKSSLAHFKGRKFNVFILNDVLEHIFDTAGLLENLSKLADDDAVIMFDVPNGHSIVSFNAEGHTGIFAVSLADPDCWHFFGRERARIYYRRWPYFVAHFREYGFDHVRLVDTDSGLSRSERVDKLCQAKTSARDSLVKIEHNKSLVSEVVQRFQAEIDYDVENSSDTELDLKYFNYFWRGVAARSPKHIRAPEGSMISPHDWGLK